jgi:hypothetical protein
MRPNALHATRVPNVKKMNVGWLKTQRSRRGKEQVGCVSLSLTRHCAVCERSLSFSMYIEYDKICRMSDWLFCQ